MVKYKTTKEECQAQIKGVCEGCGGELEPIETVNNAGEPTFWVGCEHCSSFRSGVDKKYFEVARYCVKENIVRPYSMRECDYKTPERLSYFYDTQTASLSHIIRQIHLLLKESEAKQ